MIRRRADARQVRTVPPPGPLPSILGERFLGGLPDARTRHNRNSKSSADPYYGHGVVLTREDIASDDWSSALGKRQRPRVSVKGRVTGKPHLGAPRKVPLTAS